MASFLKPVDSKVLAALDPVCARELSAWSTRHSSIFGLRLHSIHTCPFLAYIPAYMLLHKNLAKWAPWLHKFYSHKHKEERHCRCDALLSVHICQNPGLCDQ